MKTYSESEKETYNPVYEVYCTNVNGELKLVMNSRTHLNNILKIYSTRKFLGGGIYEPNRIYTEGIASFYDSVSEGMYYITENNLQIQKIF